MQTFALGALGTRHLALGTRHWALGIGHWAQGRELGTRHWALGTGHWALGTGNWALVSGHWALGTGHRALHGLWVLGRTPTLMYSMRFFSSDTMSLERSMITLSEMPASKFEPAGPLLQQRFDCF